jgi:regulator of replication initiation timing
MTQDLQNTISTLTDSVTDLTQETSYLRGVIKKQIEESESLRFRLSELEKAL